MPKEILIRNLPSDILVWIKSESSKRKMSQQEFVSEILAELKETKMQNSLFSYTRIIKKPEITTKFSFIDLFAGIGGFRIALEGLGGDCVFSSEWDKYSQKTYGAWFGEIPDGDIRKIKPSDIPDHDILTAGFPCQPFSIAGVSKKISLGKAHGFKDKNQGNLFFYLATIIGVKRPPVLFLENVKNLQSHDKGKTWSVIKKTLENLGYTVFFKIHDAAHWVPQHRERILIIGFDKKMFGENPDFEFPELPKADHQLKEILEQKPDSKYTLSEHLWKYLQNYAQKHREKGNGFGFGIADPNGITRTLSARYHKDGSEILLAQKGKKPPRRLTPRECARLMGFPEEAKIVVSDTQAYRQFGNAVAVPMIDAVGKEILKIMLPRLSNRIKVKVKQKDMTVMH
jgi:DNA (cytosine-5)-methyltransferase 1